MIIGRGGAPPPRGRAPPPRPRPAGRPAPPARGAGGGGGARRPAGAAHPPPPMITREVTAVDVPVPTRVGESVVVEPDAVRILDRRVFPFERTWVTCRSVEDVA